MSTAEAMIKSDLAALGEDSRRNLVGLDDALRTTNMYRDDRPGAEARRDALADERRRELVMMPLTLSHVYAHRIGRAAAGAGALACTLVLVVMLADPLLMRFAAWLVPGLNVGMLVALTTIAVLAIYVVATWIAEAWFARRMRASINTGDDAYADLDQLARGPVEIAQHAVRRIDGLSTGLFLAGVTALVLVFGYISLIVGVIHEVTNAWSIAGVLGTGTLERNLEVLLVPLFGTTALAFFLGRGCQRDSESTLVKLLGHWGALVVAFVAILITAYVGFHVTVTMSTGHRLPSIDVRYGLGLGAAFAIVVAAAWALLWWRRRENARID